LEDVAFGPLNQGKGVEEAKTIAKDTLHSLGLEGLDNRITHKLSGGEKKLVSLATVLAMKPQVLLLDEPTTGLHSETTERIIGILKDIDISYVFIWTVRSSLKRRGSPTPMPMPMATAKSPIPTLITIARLQIPRSHRFLPKSRELS
jgi:cobalt/nickel transport system ATP-binding protein